MVARLLELRRTCARRLRSGLEGPLAAGRRLLGLDPSGWSDPFAPTVSTPASPSAESVFQGLQARGLTAAQRCVQFGCGDVKLAGLLIDYLECGNYVGLDDSANRLERIYRCLPSRLIQTKRPVLARIEPSLILAVAADPPDIVFSTSALDRAGPGELDKIARDLCRLIGPRTAGWICFRRADAPIETDGVGWAYPEKLVLELFQSGRSDLGFHLSRDGLGADQPRSLLGIRGRDLPPWQAPRVVEILADHSREGAVPDREPRVRPA